MRDDHDLLTKCGRENPFRVPEGYFSHFNEELMNQLPQHQQAVEEPAKISLFTRVKPFLYMAAMFCGTILLFQVVRSFSSGNNQSAVAQTEDSYYSDEEIESIMATSLYDEYTLYSYLTTNETY